MKFIGLIAILLIILSCSPSAGPEGDTGVVAFNLSGDVQLQYISTSVEAHDKALNQAFSITSSMRSGNRQNSFLMAIYDEIIIGELMNLEGGNYIIVTIDGTIKQNYRSESISIRFEQYDQAKILAEFTAEMYNIDDPSKISNLLSGKIEVFRK
ncbi:MAG: hypothetical protein CVV22_12705 [Ignavibacteriae bacterium HGW-Ignavibacteriae-1]|jgi:hypothetical protein|nr:MAG: hypothetical protein CVV22_12705 [Ignavibacteriae bacterium HGW-Ignavibacteriae-1]